MKIQDAVKVSGGGRLYSSICAKLPDDEVFSAREVVEKHGLNLNAFKKWIVISGRQFYASDGRGMAGVVGNTTAIAKYRALRKQGVK